MCSFVGACACCRVKEPRGISYDNLLVSRFSCMASIMHDASYSTTFVKKDIRENAYYESDKRYIMQFPRMFLTPIGIWPLLKAQVSKTERLLSFIFLVTCFVLMCFILIPSTINILVLENDINILTKNIGPTIFCFSSAIKYFYFAWHRRDLRICIEYVENDWKAVREEEDRGIMLKHAILGRRLTKLSAIFLYTGGISFHTIMPFIAGRRIVGNMTVRTFIYNGYDIFFDSQTSPSYEIVLSIHCFTAVIMYNITTASCSLAAVFVTHVCARIEIVMSRINDLVDDNLCNHEYINYRLATIVREHVNVLRFARIIERVLREICLFELVVSSLTTCLLEYHCITEWVNSDRIAISIYFILLVSLSFNIFIFCYIGELLVEQCSQVAQACYDNGWYYLPNKKALNFILITMISQYPPNITAGKIVKLSLYTFGKVLNTSFVYLNVLRTITNESISVS